MAGIGSSEPPRLAKYDVFLSFRGRDTRKTFTDYLYQDMKDAGIRVFRDDDELYKGKELASELPRAISNSRICIPIFSKNYVTSAWCLREVAHMVECWVKTKGAVEILPIFYDVGVDEVKLKKGSYKDDIEKHRARFKDEIIQQWKNALVQMGRMKGWTLNDAKGQGELVKSIVQDLLIKLNIRYRNLPSNVVGLDNEVEALMKLIDVDSEGVKFIVIHGMGGIGKTTLAKVVFNQLVNCYEGCSFLDNVRESAKSQEMLHLQKKLLSDVFNPKVAEAVNDTNGGINRIRGQMSSKRVLIVLDDIDERDQLQNLAGRSDWFGSGSRIIITTRNQGVLAGERESGKYFYHELEQMRFTDALSLFSWHAFRKDSPPRDYDELSGEIVSAMGRLPLALEVVGSLLFCRCRDICKCKTIWRDTFNKLRRVPDKKIQDTLMISIEKLDFEQRQVFLDIACFLINEDRANAIYMWSDCDFSPHNAIKFLFELSLLKFVDKNKFWMHDVVRDIGREMVREKSIYDPGRRSRVWNSQEARDIIKQMRGTNVTEVLCLDGYEGTITHDAISTLQNLRFLRIPGANLEGDFMDHLLNLRWLVWHSVPATFKVVNFHPRNLVVLDLYNSSITEDWGGWKQLRVANKLKVLDLTRCSKLKRTPDFSNFLQLEKLILRECNELAELDPSICKLEHLTHLNMEFCRSLGKLPEQIGSLTSLEYLSLAFCENLLELPSSIGDLVSLVELDISHSRNLQQLPESIENMKNMKVIKMSYSSIRRLPHAISLLQNLEVIQAQSCLNLKVGFPMGMEGLSSLKILNFSNSAVYYFPGSLTKLSLLEELHFKLPREFEISQFPELPSSLKSLHIGSSNFRLDFVPNLSNLINLANLELHLSASSGTDLWWIGKLSKLEEMKIFHEKITTLPQELASLMELKKVSLNCPCLQRLPRLPSQLETLEVQSLLDSKCSPAVIIPCLEDLQMLQTLKIKKCWFRNLDGLHFLSSLRKLSIEFYPCRFPDLSSLRKLKSLQLLRCDALVEIQGLGELKLLEQLEIFCCVSLERIHGLPGLINLKRLHIIDCPNLRKIQGIDQMTALFSLSISRCDSLVLDTSNLDIPKQSIQKPRNMSPRLLAYNHIMSRISQMTARLAEL